MFCPKCGKETSQDQAFCASCGASLAQAATQGAPALGAGISPKSRVVAMFCRNCGKEIAQTQEICLSCGASPTSGTSFCNVCGAATNTLAEVCVKCGAKFSKPKKLGVSGKSRLGALLICGLVGLLFDIGGIHRLYLGRIGTGVTMLVLTIVGFATCWFFVGIPILIVVWVWSLIDFIFIAMGRMKDNRGDVVSVWLP
jgi:TM2 domain-containing membrane protein YozV